MNAHPSREREYTVNRISWSRIKLVNFRRFESGRHPKAGSYTRVMALLFSIGSLTLILAAYFTLGSFSSSLLVVTLGVTVILAIVVAATLRKEAVSERIYTPNRPHRFFLVTQFLFLVFFLCSSILVAIEFKTSNLTCVAYACCSVCLVFAASSSVSARKMFVVVTESASLVALFSLPLLSHGSSYHGASDLYFHISQAAAIVDTGSVPSSSYAAWPVWHIGVSGLSTVADISLSGSAFVYVGLSMLVSLPFLAGMIFRLSSTRELGAMGSVLLLLSPAFLVWLLYLTPTSLCFGFFAAAMWAKSRHTSPRFELIFFIFGCVIIFTHHLSALIVFVLLLAGHLLSGGKFIKTRSHGEISWSLRDSMILGTLAVTYWMSVGRTFFKDILSVGAVGAVEVSSSIGDTATESIVSRILLSFTDIAAFFLILCFVLLLYHRHRSLFGIGASSSRGIAGLALLSLATFATHYLPYAFLSYSIQFHRWELFGCVFMGIVGAIMFMLLIRLSYPSRAKLVALVMFVLVIGVSSSAVSSLDSLPFRENHYGLQPTPYYLRSEQAAGAFVANACVGEVSVDVVFQGYFWEVDFASSHTSLTSSYDGLQNGPDFWVMRLTELGDRGLRYSDGVTSRVVSADNCIEFFSDIHKNVILDTGSTVVLAVS